MEVSVDGAAYKPLGIQSNGYNHNIEATRIGNSVRRGFGGDSTDWYTSRATMTSFAGKHIRFRFRLLTDGFLSFSQSYGWYLDNVRLYSCRGPSAPGSVQVLNKKGAKAEDEVDGVDPQRPLHHRVVRRQALRQAVGDGLGVDPEEGLQAPHDRPHLHVHHPRQEQRGGVRHHRDEAPQDHLTARNPARARLERAPGG